MDWNAGIRAELARLFGSTEADPLLERYHAIEPRVQRENRRASYREVMALVLGEAGGGVRETAPGAGA